MNIWKLTKHNRLSPTHAHTPADTHTYANTHVYTNILIAKILYTFYRSYWDNRSIYIIIDGRFGMILIMWCNLTLNKMWLSNKHAVAMYSWKYISQPTLSDIRKNSLYSEPAEETLHLQLWESLVVKYYIYSFRAKRSLVNE